MPQVVFFSQAEATAYVTETVASLKEHIKAEHKVWVGTQKLDDAGHILKLTQQALLTTTVRSGAIEGALDEALQAKELRLVQASYAHYKGAWAGELRQRIQSAQNRIAWLDADIEEAEVALAKLLGEQQQQPAVMSHMSFAQPPSYAVWVELHGNPAPTVSSLTLNIQDLSAQQEELDRAIEQDRKTLADLPPQVDSLEATHESSVKHGYQESIEHLRDALKNVRGKIEKELVAASQGIYLDVLQAKIEDAEESSVTRALDGMVVHVRGFLATSEALAALEVEQKQLEERVSRAESGVQAATVDLGCFQQASAANRCEQESTALALARLNEAYDNLCDERAFYRSSATRFALGALFSGLVAGGVLIGVPFAFAVVASAIALCALVASLRQGLHLPKLNMRIEIQGDAVQWKQESLSVLTGERAAALSAQVSTQERVLADAERGLKEASSALQENNAQRLTHMNEKQRFFVAAEQQSEAIAAQYPSCTA
jgi:hypothetical protein